MFKVHAYCKGVRIEEGETSPCVLLMAKLQAVDVVSFALIRRFGILSLPHVGCEYLDRFSVSRCPSVCANHPDGTGKPHFTRPTLEPATLAYDFFTFFGFPFQVGLRPLDTKRG